MEQYFKDMIKIALLLAAIVIFCYGIKIWNIEFLHGEIDMPGKVTKHVNKEVIIKHDTNTAYHLIVDFGKYGKEDLHVTTVTYFDCVDGTTYYWKKNPYLMNDSGHNGWVLIGFIGIIICGLFGVFLFIHLLSWVFNFGKYGKEDLHVTTEERIAFRLNL
jgi:hypothetical protein